MHSAEHPHEHLGQVLIAAAEAGPPDRSSKELALDTRPADKKEAEQLKGRRIETLNRADLLTLSEQILVEGSSLRQIYETHLIGERGLRRLVAEHLSGGNILKALNREIIEREIDFERDPAMRDLAPGTGHETANVTDSPTTILNKLIEKAAKSVGGDEEAALLRIRDNNEADQRQHKRQRIIDVALAAIITILLILVAILLVSRG